MRSEDLLAWGSPRLGDMGTYQVSPQLGDSLIFRDLWGSETFEHSSLRFPIDLLHEAAQIVQATNPNHQSKPLERNQKRGAVARVAAVFFAGRSFT